MKRLLAFILLLGCLLCYAKADMPATPTDLEVVEQVAEVTPEPTVTPTVEPTSTPEPTVEPEPELERQVTISYEDRVYHYGEEVTLIATLINYLPTDICTYHWEYSLDCKKWETMAITEEPFYTFILDYETCEYWWRVAVYREV